MYITATLVTIVKKDVVHARKIKKYAHGGFGRVTAWEYPYNTILCAYDVCVVYKYILYYAVELVVGNY